MAIKKVQETDLLADSLDAWVEKYKLAKDPYLPNLISALRERASLHIWAELNPIDYLPHPESYAAQSRFNVIRLLTVIRNVLVFAPVALTWAAVAAATNAFAIYLREEDAQVVNFLDFWQDGYGVLEEHWRIGFVAQLDFLLVLAVIALTLYISFEGHKITQLRQNREMAIDSERLAIALEIHTVLHEKRKITAVTMNQALAGSIGRLVIATKSLEIASKSIEKTSKRVTPSASPNSDRFDFSSLTESFKSSKSRRA